MHTGNVEEKIFLFYHFRSNFSEKINFISKGLILNQQIQKSKKARFEFSFASKKLHTSINIRGKSNTCVITAVEMVPYVNQTFVRILCTMIISINYNMYNECLDLTLNVLLSIFLLTITKSKSTINVL